MTRSLLCFFLVFMSLRTVGQSEPMTVADTISISKQRVFLQMVYSYGYLGATRLAPSQLNPVLKRSPDARARQFVEQSKWLSRVSTGLVVGSAGLMVGSIEALRQNPRRAGTFILAGYGAFLGSLIPQGLGKQRFARSVTLHNANLRTILLDYVPPVVYAPSNQWTLSLADTIARRRVGLANRYIYRGIQVYPTSQLGRLTASLNDRDVSEGVRYVQTVSGISGLVGSIGRSLLVSSALPYLFARRYQRGSVFGDPLVTTSLLCIGADLALTYHANRIQQRWVIRYNDRLKERFRPE